MEACMNKLAWKSLSAVVYLALSLPLASSSNAEPIKPPVTDPPASVPAQVLPATPAAPDSPATISPASVAPKSEPVNGDILEAPSPVQQVPAIPANQVNSKDLPLPLAPKKHLSRKELKVQKLQLREDLDTTPILAEVLKLKWEVEPLQAPVKDTKKIGLDKIFHDTLSHSLLIRQAEVQIKDAEALAKDTHDPLFNPLNPFEPGSLKQAAESNAVAARAHLETVRQQALLTSAKLYADLTQAFLGKYLAYQAIEQGRAQLKEEQGRFVAGETNHFDVTQTQMALLDRYSKYLEADNAFHAASMILANQINATPENPLVPENIELQQQNQSIPLLRLLPDNLELGQVLKMLKSRPDMREMEARQVALQKLIKATNTSDKQKRKAELHQLELEAEKLAGGARVMAEKAFTDYALARKTVDMAQQRTQMANHYLYQLQISHTAGFSSAKEVLDGQIELAKVKAAQIGAQVAYNLSQIQLLYEMGQLNEQSITRPQPGLVNAL
jgi:hypothetical protein